MQLSSILAFVSLALPFVAGAHNIPHWGRRHHNEIAHRAPGEVDHYKRDAFSNARFTYYAVGLGACGQVNVPSDFIVAINKYQYGSGYPGPLCFKSITIEYGGKQAQATIMDECMGCPWGALDFSADLFSYFADQSLGEIYGTWWFNDGSGGGGDPAPTTSSTPAWTPPPTTSSTPAWTPPPTTSTPAWTPPPSSTWTPPPPTSSSSTWSPPPSSSSSTTSSTSTSTSTATSSSSVNYSTGVASGLAEPTGSVQVSTPSASNPENLLVMNEVIIGIGALAVAASDAN